VRHFDAAVDNLDERHARALGELHPQLSPFVFELLDRLGGRFKLWDGWRGEAEQNAAAASGNSNASWGESPHNNLDAEDQPAALAADLVLDPRRVQVREAETARRRGKPGWPNLWDDVAPDSLRAWADLEEQALAIGLERVWVYRRGVWQRDRPHVQHPKWLQLRTR